MQTNERKNNVPVKGYTGKEDGPQGVDKAPGEESSSSTDNIIHDSQKGKDKNDGDPSKATDEPIKNL